MFLKPIPEVIDYAVSRIREFGKGVKVHTVAVSGGVDSALVVTLLCLAFGPKNVMAVYRNVRSDPKHLQDFLELVKALGVQYRIFNANMIYDSIIDQDKEQTLALGEPWYDEGSKESKENGWEAGYASLKSRITTSILALLAKRVDNGGGRIYGTGNAEEDALLRYFDKFGDGAIDFSPIFGFLKMEVRQLVLYFYEIYKVEVFKRVPRKIASADLRSIGDAHNDEDELTALAKKRGYDIRLSYGSCEEEGNIAWAVKFNSKSGIITGKDMYGRTSLLFSREELLQIDYSRETTDLILFIREIEKETRHKDFGIPGISRLELFKQRLVDI